MKELVHIRVTKNERNETTWHLVVNGEVVQELGYIDVLNLSLNATSSLRWAEKR